MAALRRSGVWVVLVAAVLGLLMFALVHWLFFGLDEPTPWDKPARVDGSQVQLTYTGRECRDRVQVDVDEGAARVVITIRETVRTVVCRGDTASYDVDVDLGAPLAGRELVDGACSLEGNADDALCADGLVTAAR
ncbi:hypothetical protein BH11ACT8_BH11ACT8_33490 [soil metagenome]